ncbi:hypothetical protein [Thermoleptolyngbya sp.]
MNSVIGWILGAVYRVQRWFQRNRGNGQGNGVRLVGRSPQIWQTNGVKCSYL